MQQNSSISKMNFAVSTQAFIPGDTRRSMPVSTGIKEGLYVGMVFQGLCGRAVADAPAHLPLPKKPSYYMTQYGVNYNPEWPIRVNVDHILGDEENLSRIPAEIRESAKPALLLETAVELRGGKLWWNRALWFRRGIRPGAILAADLPDRYGAARPCHDPHDHGRVLLTSSIKEGAEQGDCSTVLCRKQP